MKNRQKTWCRSFSDENFWRSWYPTNSPHFIGKKSRLKIHTAHEKIGFIRVIQVIWILTEIHEYLWIWIWKPVNFYECEFVNSWISMTMIAKSHEFPWIWKKNIWAVWLWIRRQVELFIDLMWFVWILNLNIKEEYDLRIRKAYSTVFDCS